MSEIIKGEKIMLVCEAPPTIPGLKAGERRMRCEIRDRESQLQIGSVSFDDELNQIFVRHPEGWDVRVGAW